MAINIIAACDNNYLIGLNGKLPWHIPADLKRFKELTTGHAVIMGRKTFESLGNNPLPERTNIVVGRDLDSRLLRGHSSLHSSGKLARAILLANSQQHKEVFIIGGERIYAAAMPLADRIYLTRVDTLVAVKPEDEVAYFPPSLFGEEYWKMVGNELCPSFDPAQPNITFRIFERRK